MMRVSKKHVVTIITACILAIVLVTVLYFAFFFNKTTIVCDSLEKLTELTKKDFSDAEITDIQYKHVSDKAIGEVSTTIFVFLNESGELTTNDYYFDSDGGGISDPNMEYIPPGHVAYLKEMGIELQQIQKHGGNYNQIEVGFSIAPYEIHWYQIDETYDHKSNVVLIAVVPRKVSINADKIIHAAQSLLTKNDSKAVKEIPSGFIHLPKGGKMDNGLHYVSWESQISFLDDAGNCIYQTGVDNSDFIVKHKDEYYVHEEKISELLDIVNSQNK